jgi:hypothetical protein
MQGEEEERTFLLGREHRDESAAAAPSTSTSQANGYDGEDAPISTLKKFAFGFSAPPSPLTHTIIGFQLNLFLLQVSGGAPLPSSHAASCQARLVIIELH